MTEKEEETVKEKEMHKEKEQETEKENYGSYMFELPPPTLLVMH